MQHIYLFCKSNPAYLETSQKTFAKLVDLCMEIRGGQEAEELIHSWLAKLEDEIARLTALFASNGTAFPKPKVFSLLAPRITVVTKPVEDQPVFEAPLHSSPTTYAPPPAATNRPLPRETIPPSLPPSLPVLKNSLPTSSAVSSDPRRASTATSVLEPSPSAVSGPPLPPQQPSSTVPTPTVSTQPPPATQDLPPTPISARFESDRQRLSRQAPTPEPTPEVESRGVSSGPEYLLPPSFALLELRRSLRTRRSCRNGASRSTELPTCASNGSSGSLPLPQLFADFFRWFCSPVSDDTTLPFDQLPLRVRVVFRHASVPGTKWPSLHLKINNSSLKCFASLSLSPPFSWSFAHAVCRPTTIRCRTNNRWTLLRTFRLEVRHHNLQREATDASFF